MNMRWSDIAACQQKREQELAEAERYWRLMAGAEPKNKNSVFCQVLSSLGSRMVKMGTGLVKRYGNLTPQGGIEPLAQPRIS